MNLVTKNFSLCNWIDFLTFSSVLSIEQIDKLSFFFFKFLVSKFGALVFFRLHLMTFYFFLNLFIVTWRIIIVLISAIRQHGSVIGIHVPSSLSLHPTPSHPSRLSQSPSLSSPTQTANSHWLSVLHMVVGMFPCCSLLSPHPLRPGLCPGPTSLLLCLCLYCCPVNRFISTIFLLMTFEIFVHLFGCAGS